MAGRIAYTGNIVRNGLVLLLDAAKKDSYLGTGTAWNDISGNGNNGTLTNGPAFNSNNNGSIVFDGTNDYITLGTPSSLNITGNFTVNSWVKVTMFPSVIGTIYEKGFDGVAEQIYFRFRNNSGTQVLDVGTYKATNNTNYSTTYIVGSNIIIGSWYNIVGQYDGANWIIYLNGTLVSSTLQNQGPLASSAPVSIGAAYISSGYERFFNGSIGTVQIYNRALSAAEVSQNFNALRGRYGI